MEIFLKVKKSQKNLTIHVCILIIFPITFINFNHNRFSIFDEKLDIDDNDQSRHIKIDPHLYQADIPEYLRKLFCLFSSNLLTNVKEVK